MPMKFNSFPYLVKMNIINQMTFKSIFSASLCSKRTRALIEFCLKKKVKSIKYCFLLEGIQVIVQDESDMSVEVMVEVQAADRSQTYYNQVTMIGNTPQIVVFHKRKSRRGDGQVVIKYGLIYEEYIKRAIVDHVTSLLKHSSPIIRLEVENRERLGTLVPIPGIRSTSVLGVQVDGSVLDRIFKNNESRSAIIRPELIKDFSENSPLFHLPALYCRNSNGFSRTIVERFTGQDLELHGAYFDEEDVLSVLQNWFSGEAYENLKVMHIQAIYPIRRQRIRFDNNDDGERHWSLEPFMFEYESLHHSNVNETMSIDLRRFRPLQRLSDGMMAAYRVSGDVFRFVVWNKTRDEFVEMDQ
ncbi:hypothetical protein CAEBREN_09231 [Caenorhabditis brenneri]|uniref:F-box domain-containing protein n=1 Tax=Caenorhabditis brenneri TaxID=135651 RepID=G0MMA1_CAEBE|nr:hypothetical protein CAEBREN_09231 [Caenorhabditis brenneri]